MKTNKNTVPSLGDKVKVTTLLDEAAEQKFMGHVGEVIEIIDPSYVDDNRPLYYIQFANGLESFFAEELQIIQQ